MANGVRFTRRRVVSLVAAAQLVGLKASAEPFRPDMALWVWEDIFSAPEEIERFVVKYQIKTIFLFISPERADALLARNKDCVATISNLKKMGVKILALAGEPEWAWGEKTLTNYVRQLIKIATQTSLFDGVSFDVEPQALPEWEDIKGQKRLIAGTLSFYDHIRAMAPQAVMDIAVNPIFSQLTSENGIFMSELAAKASSLSLMAYRLDVQRAISWAMASIQQFEALERWWRMGILVGEGEKGTSLKGATAADFTNFTVELDRLIINKFHPSFYQGLVIEDYKALKKIYEKP